MPKYALVVTDTGLFPGTNAMVNAFKYYDIQAEFHYLHKLQWAAEFAEKRSDDVVGVSIDDLIEEYDIRHPKLGENVWYCKMYRYLYAINHLIDYDAVCIIDADMVICNDITPWFEIADKLDRLVIPNNDYSGQEHDGYNLPSIQGASSPPFHNMPSFFKPKTWEKVLRDIPKISLENTYGDMSSLTHSLIRHGKMDDPSTFLMTPNALWVHSHYCHIKLAKRKIGGKWYVCLHNIGGDRLYSFHRRWWMASLRRKFVDDIKDPVQRETGRNNVQIFYEMTKFFNTDDEMKYHIEWKREYESEKINEKDKNAFKKLPPLVHSARS